MPKWLQDIIDAAQHVAGTPDRVEGQVAQTSAALQHTLDQLVFWAEVVAIVVIIATVVRAGFALYNWNLRRREVIAEEKQADAELAQAVALKAILAELRRLNPPPIPPGK